jgi:hypothetical protein
METFSVCQFFEDESYEWVRTNVPAEEAVKAFQHYTNNVAVKLGVTKRVIITDSGDCVCYEWKHGKGITFPTKEELDNARTQTPKEEK